MVYDSMKSHDVSEEQLHMRTFPFSHVDSAQRWLYYLASGSITMWANVKKKFLEKKTSHLS